MKRNRKVEAFVKARDEMLRWQEQTGITLVGIRRSDKPGLWEYNLNPLHKMVKEITALEATGMSTERAAQIVAERIKKEAEERKANA
jgi:hypothetical protein